VWSPMPEESQSMSCPTTPPLPQNKPLVDVSPKISSADRIIIVDVITHPSLYHSFMSEWAEATVYSLSLACDPSTQKPHSTTADPSIGPHITTSSSQSVLGMYNKIDCTSSELLNLPRLQCICNSFYLYLQFDQKYFLLKCF